MIFCIRHSRALEDLRDELLARLNPRDALRSEADAEAVLAGLGEVTRPRPTVTPKPAVTNAVIKALRGPFRLRVCYGDQGAAPRVIEPHGMLLGHHTYLVARQPARGEDILNFRMDRIHEAELLNESFQLASGFSLDTYAAQAFGVYQDPEQYGEVVWRFTPEAAERAAEFRFHPTQVQWDVASAYDCLGRSRVPAAQIILIVAATTILALSVLGGIEASVGGPGIVKEAIRVTLCGALAIAGTAARECSSA